MSENVIFKFRSGGHEGASQTHVDSHQQFKVGKGLGTVTEKKHVEKQSGDGKREWDMAQSWQKTSTNGQSRGQTRWVPPGRRSSETKVRSLGFIIRTMVRFGGF